MNKVIDNKEQVAVGANTIVSAFNFIVDNTKLGKNCLVLPFNYVKNSSVGNNCVISASTIKNSTIKNNVKVGPNAHLRPNSVLSKGVKIGNFVEVKNSNLGKNTKASHLSYLGDGEVGENVNIGAGVIFCNYDGKNKHKTKINNNAFVGSNVSLVAPITLGENSIVGAGSTLTKNVESNALAIARSRQTNKQNYVKTKEQ